MAIKLIWSLLFFSTAFTAFGQKYVNLKAKFSLVEKNTLKDTASLVHGEVNYNLTNNETIYSIIFPQEESWHFLDSTLTIQNLDKKVTRKELANINQETIFNKILTYNLNDFGLKQSGFTIAEVEELDQSVIMKWAPPSHIATYLDYVITEISDNNLQSIMFVDVDGKVINQTYYEDYEIIYGIPVPKIMKSHFRADKEEIFKVLKLSNVEIF